MERVVSLKALGDAWESAIVARGSIEKFSGGLIKPGTLANHDAAGTGPPKMRMGRIVYYMVDDVIDWIECRSEMLS